MVLEDLCDDFTTFSALGHEVNTISFDREVFNKDTFPQTLLYLFKNTQRAFVSD